MKPIKIWVDENKPDGPGWVHAKTFFEFSCLLDTVDLSSISLISFGTDLETDEYDIGMNLDAADGAVYLVEKAKGKELPACFNHTDNKKLQDIINHYTKSYKHSNYCGKYIPA